MADSARYRIQVEWFNVTYRSVISVLAVLVGAAATLGGGWYYANVHVPKAGATAAIERADRRLDEASAVAGDDRVVEVVESAAAALREARAEFAGLNYDDARIAAVRSENLSLKALREVGQLEGGDRRVSFARIEGDVRVKRAGEFSWEPAGEAMTLRIGDQVKTSSSSSAELRYFDGTRTTIQPGSLLEIRELYENPVTKERKVRERLDWGEVRASTRERNVAGSVHEVATERVVASSEDASEFRVAVDKDGKQARVDAFGGRVNVTGGGRTQSVGAGEGIKADERGVLGAKYVLPGVPRLLAPPDQRVFISESPQNVTLRWQAIPGASRYRLLISQRPLFTETLHDAIHDETQAVFEVPAGSYHWKVAAVGATGTEGPFSDPRGFRVSTRKIRDSSDTEAPDLELTEFVTVGLMVIVNGRTEPGATLWANDEKIEVSDDGTFYSVIRLRQEGLNEIRFVAQDTAGNETVVERQTYIELY